MGQQQLLLLVLGIVLVGLAVVVGIQGFQENSDKAKRDRQVGAMVEMAAQIDAWRKKPGALGGGYGRTWENSFRSFAMLGMNHEPGDARMRYIEHVGCAGLGGSIGGNYGAIQIFDIDACPAAYSDLDLDTMLARMRVYEDYWMIIFGSGSNQEEIRIDW